jgi:hypothetical protein
MDGGNDVDPGNRRAHIELMTPALASAVAISTRFPRAHTP